MENAFGILAHRWRILRRPMEFKSRERVISVIKACVALHNFCCSKSHKNPENARSYIPFQELTQEDSNGNVIEGSWNIDPAERNKDVDFRSNRFSKKAENMREEIADFFISDAGAVPWQEKSISVTLKK